MSRSTQPRCRRRCSGTPRAHCGAQPVRRTIEARTALRTRNSSSFSNSRRRRRWASTLSRTRRTAECSIVVVRRWSAADSCRGVAQQPMATRRRVVDYRRESTRPPGAGAAHDAYARGCGPARSPRPGALARGLTALVSAMGCGRDAVDAIRTRREPPDAGAPERPVIALRVPRSPRTAFIIRSASVHRRAAWHVCSLPRS